MKCVVCGSRAIAMTYDNRKYCVKCKSNLS